MRSFRPVIAADPHLFGRRREPIRPLGAAILQSDDVRLFLTTFVAGFIFVLLLIA